MFPTDVLKKNKSDLHSGWLFQEGGTEIFSAIIFILVK